MGDVVTLSTNTTLGLPPDRVLSAAMGSLKETIIIGTDENGFYFASSSGDLERILWLVEKAKRRLARMDDEAEDSGSAA